MNSVVMQAIARDFCQRDVPAAGLRAQSPGRVV